MILKIINNKIIIIIIKMNHKIKMHKIYKIYKNVKNKIPT